MTTKCAVGSDSTEWMVITLLLLAQSSSSPPTQSQASLGGGGVVSNLFMRAPLASALQQVLSSARRSSMLPQLYGES